MRWKRGAIEATIGVQDVLGSQQTKLTLFFKSLTNIIL
jgi:hypothetical protein